MGCFRFDCRVFLAGGAWRKAFSLARERVFMAGGLEGGGGMAGDGLRFLRAAVGMRRGGEVGGRMAVYNCWARALVIR